MRRRRFSPPADRALGLPPARAFGLDLGLPDLVPDLAKAGLLLRLSGLLSFRLSERLLPRPEPRALSCLSPESVRAPKGGFLPKDGFLLNDGLLSLLRA